MILLFFEDKNHYLMTDVPIGKAKRFSSINFKTKGVLISIKLAISPD